MLKRQKSLLYCFRENGGRIGKTKLTKIFFLLREEYWLEKHYDFAPYSFWPFSRVLYSDLRFLQKKWYLTDKWNGVYYNESKELDLEGEVEDSVKEKITNITRTYKTWSGEHLMKLVYKKFPYYAIKSKEYWESFKAHCPSMKPEMQKPTIFTIGYEWRSIDKYVDILVRNNVNTLIDIRNNPVSMKYWFTYTTLWEVCKNHGIKYKLVKELGIESTNRQELNTYDDYVALFKEYKKTLPSKKEYVYNIKEHLDNGERIALTCFEEDHKYCHRCETSKYLHSITNKKYELRHI